MVTRRGLTGLAALGLASFALGLPFPGSVARAGEAELGDNGLYVQDWFLDSFLDMQEDLEDAAGQGKHFAVIWEQRGCPYCRELHQVNLASDKIRAYLSSNFVLLQLDLWGSREVTDFDGAALEERAMARKWAINFTPTIQFFAKDPAAAKGKPAHHVEVARMPGYFKPFHFLAMFEFVREEHYKKIGFQRYLQNKFAEYEAKGIDPEVW
jgi:thioredoxin-related protein